MNFNQTNMEASSILSNDYCALARVGQHQGDSYIGRGAKQRRLDRPKNMPELIGAIDQGTSSTRFLVFENQTGHLVASSQMEIRRITPKEGWVEIDPLSIMSSVHATIANVYDQLVARYNLPPKEDETSGQYIENLLNCIGICNQRESAVVWDARTGQPLYNVIVWMDNRTKYIVDEMIDSTPGRDFNRFKDKTGLPMSTYFSAFKLKWLMDNVDEVKVALKEGRLLFGTVDTWILWNLTGGNHLTDVTNASRTFLMDIETLQWDKTLCKHFKVPLNILPEIRASADNFGCVQHGPFNGTPITGVIGDQSAALFGHNCLQIGQTKATFGTGCFIMQNIGPGPVSSALTGVHRDAKRGLVTTVGYKLGDRPACYALEGCIKIAGAALTWLRDNIQLIENYEECDILVNKTTNSAGVFFVPALGGLYSPYWDPNAAGMFIGLSQFTRREHLVRATFDSIAFQTNDILSLMRGVANGLMIDGGLCKSDNLCQILADITGYDIIRPSMCETSALGAAMVAGYGAGLWSYESMAAHSNEPLDVSLSYPNQTHHYPHESLYHENEYTPSTTATTTKNHKQAHESESRFRARTKSMTSNEAAARHRRHSVKQNRAALAAANQQHHRQHLKSANGVNDDAGGGKEGDRGGGWSVDQNHDDYDDADSSSGPLVASVTTSNTAEFAPSVSGASARIRSFESSLESDGRQTMLDGPSGAMAAPSSGYSSGDNFEQATSYSCVSTRERVDSPLSQATDGVASHSITPYPMDLNSNPMSQSAALRDGNQAVREQLQSRRGGHELAPDERTQQEAQSLRGHPFYMNQFLKRRDQVVDRVGSITDNSDRRTSDIRSDADDQDEEDDDLVHEFGGRDSYGEDGYDSSSASFDSYETDEEEIDNIDQTSGVVTVGEETKNHEVGNTDFNECDGQQPRRSIRHRASKRQKHSNVSTKQLDVFQPYISLDHRTDLVNTWGQAVGRSMQWTKVHHEEVKRIDYQRLSTLPISMYIFFSLGIVTLSGILSTNGSLSGLGLESGSIL